MVVYVVLSFTTYVNVTVSQQELLKHVVNHNVDIREITGLGLAEAKAAVEGTPKTLKEALSKEDAEAMKAKVEEAGGKVELK